MRNKGLVELYRENELTLWVSAISIVVLSLALGSVLYPEVFWDGFLYHYFWGPIVSDQAGERVDVAEGYNMVNTLVYAIILTLSLLAMLRVFRRMGIAFDATMATACIPLFLFGGTARALEDTSLFSGGLQLLFISPLIYVIVIAIFLAAVLLGLMMRRVPGRAWWLLVTIMGASFLLAQYLLRDDLAHTLGVVPVAGAAIVAGVAYEASSKRWDGVHASLLSVGTFTLALTVISLFAFTHDAGWIAHYVDVTGGTPTPRYEELLYIPALASIGVIVAYAIGRLMPSTHLADPLNMMMFAGHMLDGSATYRGIEIYGYSEKHVLPRFLIDSTGTAAVMLPLKFMMVVAVVYVLDVLLRDDLRDNRDLVTALKFVIVFLGLSPGVRDMVRIALGV